MGSSVVFQYVYTAYDEIRVIGTYVTSKIYHFFLVGIFRILSILKYN
jgi:hypothetical protein